MGLQLPCGGAHIPAEIQRRGVVQVVGRPANKGFGGSERESELEGLLAKFDEGAAGR